jgi:lycopene cyclase domain-containing protein
VSFLYLAALVVSLAGTAVLDVRYRLFFARDAKRAGIVLAVGVLFFLAWDLAGIGLGLFFVGQGRFLTGIVLAPELPLEEVFFLTLLCWTAMNAFGAGERVLERRRV